VLDFPSKDASRSDPRLDVLCDWIEASALFSGTPVSSVDAREVLVEDKVCERQDAADDLLADVWRLLRARQGLLGDGSPFRFKDQHIEAAAAWTDVPEYAYCLAVSYAFWDTPTGKSFGSDYTEQGELFENLTQEALAHIFPGWSVHHTGWTRTKAQKIKDVVRGVAGFLGNAAREEAIAAWDLDEANEAGLDMVLMRPFSDTAGFAPLYFMQCASGGHWKPKTSEPHIKTWEKLIDLTYAPQKAFASPLSLLDGKNKHSILKVDGIMLDRYRLLSGYRTGKPWTSPALRKKLVAWLKPRVKKLLKQAAS